MKQVYLSLVFAFFACLGTALPSQTAEDTLRQADVLAEHFDWAKALPLYVEAEHQFSETGNAAGSAYARLGSIRASVKDRAPQQIADALNREIRRSPLRGDLSFRLRALFLKADVETDIDSYSAGVFNADQRRRDWQEILDLAQKANDRRLESRAQGELALLKLLEGSSAASDDLSAVLWAAKEAGDSANELRFRTAIAAMYRSAGRTHDALGHLDRALDLAEREQVPSFFPAFFEKALALIDEKRLQEAQHLVDHCITQARIAGSEINKAQALYLQGKVRYANGGISEADDLLKQSLDIASDLGYHRLISMASLDLSRIYRVRGELWKALDCAHVGLQSSVKTGDPFDAIIHVHNQGAIRAGQGRFTEADRLYSQALGALNALLAKFTSAHARAFIVSRLSDLYADYFSLSLLKLKDPAKAFSILEQARGRSVSDSIRGRFADPFPANGNPIPNPYEEHEKDLARLQVQLWRKKDPQQFRVILSEIFDLEQRLGTSREAGRHSIESQTFPTIPLSEIQKILYPGEIVLEYVLQEPSSTCLAISKEDVQGIALPSRQVIEEAVEDYRREIQQGKQGAQIAQKLYDLLLAPIKDLNGKLRITIIPDGLLHLLPFEAIPTPAGRLLIEQHMIDYSPAASITFLLRKMPPKQSGQHRFLGVGDARYPSYDESGSAFFSNIPQPARLPGSRAEISSIAQVLKGVSENATLLGEDVNEAAIKSLSLPDFDILHFAVHGTSDLNFPARSALLLGPTPDESEDGIFQAREISRLRLKADLVVLSACDTAVGKVLDQEGVSNLVQAFLLAGARSVVASIWAAEDRSTADLMTRFYSYLAQGMDKGSALRQAKLDFIEKYKDKALPVHWAGMIMIGDSSDSILGKHQDTIPEEIVSD